METKTTKYPLLENISSPADLRKLPEESLPQLCKELRGFIIDSLANNPGHFASSLGSVEMTVALHYVYATPEDKIVWDVGHQAYGHKILTGRRDRFSTLRQNGGLSGFPCREESEHDCFGAGHASTSLSAALLVVWMCRRGAVGTSGLLVKALGVACIAAVVIIALLLKNGKLSKLISAEGHKMVYAACAVAAAGMAAHLAGAVAANTTLPVIGIPCKSSTLDGLDALLSTVQMPSGIPVATVAIGGAANAALLAAEILAVGDDALAAKLIARRESDREKVLAKDAALTASLAAQQ